MFKLLGKKCLILSLPFLVLFCSQVEKGVKPDDRIRISRLSPKKVQFRLSSYHYILAQLKRHEGDLDGTIDEFKQAITYDPKSALLHVELAKLYIQKDDEDLIDDAIAECKKALSINRNFVPARIVLGGLYTSIKKSSLAIEQYRKVLRIDPENQQAYLHLASLYYRELQQFDEAIETLEKLIDKFPDHILGLY
ncbi:MAG: tetratricopeptide repeat protein, partial [Deltaproteobacteria bacterium]|nr:tetratricopeptide repeat protein [Deltaproteobacteria bacterium]